MTTSDQLTFTPRVTWRHGAIFAKIWLADSLKSEGPPAAFNLTSVIQYPDEIEDNTPAKIRYEALMDEILHRTLDAVENTVANTFVRVASEVIERESKRDRKMRDA